MKHINDYTIFINEKRNRYAEVIKSVSLSKKLKNKEAIRPYLTSGSKYNTKYGLVTGLKKPKVKGKSFDGVGLGADKNGFFCLYT